MNKTFFAMNTSISLSVYGADPAPALARCEEKIHAWERLWSVTRPGSEIHAINHAGGAPVPVSRETAELIQFSLDMASRTDGALDISLYPILTAWGFTTGTYQIPSDDELARRRERTGYRKITFSGSRLTMPRGMQIDLGAVAKGYACDRLADLLKTSRVASALLNLGGTIQTIGAKPDGSVWKISVQHPDAGDSLGILSLTDASAATSGTYQRFFTGSDGKRYGHILDPRTGRPADSRLASVTVISKAGCLSDALSTALFVMGPARAEAYWRRHRGFDMLLVTDGGALYLTEGLEAHFTLAAAHRAMPLTILRA